MTTTSYDLQLSMLSGGSRLERGQMDLLARIKMYGTLTEAAKTLGISYKTACAWMTALNRAAEAPLVLASHGGTDRGGTIITDLGLDYLQRYDRIQELHQRLQFELEKSVDFASFWERLRMRSCARNHFVGKVETLFGGEVRKLVAIRADSGLLIQSQVLSRSAREMQLLEGGKATAIFKASSVLLEPLGETCKPFPPNCWVSKIVEIQEDLEGVEVQLHVEGGVTISCLLDRATWNELHLQTNEKCLAQVPPVHVSLFRSDG